MQVIASIGKDVTADGVLLLTAGGVGFSTNSTIQLNVRHQHMFVPPNVPPWRLSVASVLLTTFRRKVRHRRQHQLTIQLHVRQQVMYEPVNRPSCGLSRHH